jgi:uncharacterized protein YdhG (YjbR/CyaY superfamily)
MAMTEYASIADYIAAQPRAAQGALKQVRSAIRKALPSAKESLSYKIPTYKIDGKVVIYFAGWAKHYSLYPCGPTFVAAFKRELARYERSKGTLRFPLDADVPVKLIAAIAKFRAREVAARAKGTRSKA